MRENTDWNNSEYGHFLRSEALCGLILKFYLGICHFYSCFWQRKSALKSALPLSPVLCRFYARISTYYLKNPPVFVRMLPLFDFPLR